VVNLVDQYGEYTPTIPMIYNMRAEMVCAIMGVIHEFGCGITELKQRFGIPPEMEMDSLDLEELTTIYGFLQGEIE